MSSTINAGTSGLVLTGSTTTTLSLATNGTTRATIDASGNLGIGTASPGYKLDVVGNGKVSNDFQVNTGRTISGGSGGALISSTGINTDFVSTGRAAAITGAWGTVRIHQVAGYAGLRLIGDTSQTAAYMDVENSSGSILYRIDSSGNVGIGTASPVAGYRLNVVNDSGNAQQLIRAGTNFNSTIAFGDQNSSTSGQLIYAHNGDYMAFNTNAAERMRIDSSGNVGIGTASPSFKFEVQQGSASASPSLRQTPQVVLKGHGGAGTYHSGIGFSMYEHTNGYWGSGILEVDDSGSYGAAMAFYTSTGSATPTPSERFRIGSLGQFGIGGANYGTAGQVLTSNGSGAAPSWQTVGGSSLKSQTFTSSGTFTVPTGITSVWVTMVGGGGSGGGGAGNVQAAGGGAGAYTIKRAVSVTPGANVSVTVGGGGAGVLTNGSQGNNGSASSFGSVSVSGGGGGNRVNGSTTLSAGTTGVGGANGGSPSNNVRLPPGSIGGIGGLFSSTNQTGGGAGGLFGDGTDGWYLGSSSSAGANTGAGSGAASENASGNYSTGNGGSGMVIVEWLG